ncbi:L-arabinokinase, partial [Cucurbita argyrosperma subsp. argyrosperma]
MWSQLEAEAVSASRNSHEVHVASFAPQFVFTSAMLSPGLFIRKELLDCGAVQTDAITIAWDFIYAQYAMDAGHHHRSIVWQCVWRNSLSMRRRNPGAGG